MGLLYCQRGISVGWRKQKTDATMGGIGFEVGVDGFEPPTLCL